MNYKMTIQYDGGRYAGWQRQGNTDKTIQGRLEQTLSRLLHGPIEVQGSGRTDAGVHALGQVANFKTDTPIPSCEDFLVPLNDALPDDIAVIRLAPASARFHARLSAREKIYRYTIWNSPIPNVMERKYVYHLPDPLDEDAMETAARRMLGTHDFSGFSADRTKKSTVRYLRSVELRREGARLTLTFTGNGFLHNMVRILTGTLIETGLHQRDPESIDRVFETQDRKNAGFTAPAQGLCLMQVIY